MSVIFLHFSSYLYTFGNQFTSADHIIPRELKIEFPQNPHSHLHIQTDECAPHGCKMRARFSKRPNFFTFAIGKYKQRENLQSGNSAIIIPCVCLHSF